MEVGWGADALVTEGQSSVSCYRGNLGVPSQYAISLFYTNINTHMYIYIFIYTSLAAQPNIVPDFSGQQTDL